MAVSVLQDHQCFVVLDKYRFAVLGWPCTLTRVDGSVQISVALGKAERMPVWFTIANWIEWKVWVVEQQPPVHAVAAGTRPTVILVSSVSMTLMQRQARLGFRDISIIYVNKLIKLVPAALVNVKPATVIEKVALLCCLLWPEEKDIASMLANRVEPPSTTQPLVTTAHNLTDEVMDQTDKREMASDQQKEANKVYKCLVCL